LVRIQILMKLFILLIPFTLFGNISFDFSSATPKFLRSTYPAIRAAEMPPEKKIYSKEFLQHTHITSGFQYETKDLSKMLDVSINLGMSKKPLGVKESIFCFSFPKVMMYKKVNSKFFGAGMNYSGVKNGFSNEIARAVQAGLSMGVEYATKTNANHIFQVDFTQSIRTIIPAEARADSTYPSTLLEFSYGAEF